MTAKQRLESIKANRELIQRLNARKKNLGLMQELRAIDYTTPRVQQSRVNVIEEKAWQYYERIENINKKIENAYIAIDDTMNDIDEQPSKYSQVLFMRYAEDKPLQEIANDLNYSYHYLCNLHTAAITEFDEYLRRKYGETKN